MNSRKLFNQNSIQINTVFYLLGIILVQGASVLTSPIFTRLLTTYQYGQNSLYLTYVLILTNVVGFNMNGTLIIMRERVTAEEYKRYKSSILFLSFVLFLFSIMAVMALFPSIKMLMGFDLFTCILACFHSFGSYCINFRLNEFVNEGRSTKHLLLSAICSILSIFFSIIIINFPQIDNGIARNIGISIPYILIGMYYFVSYLWEGKCLYNTRYWKYAINYSWPLIFHSLGYILLAQGDRIMIKLFNSPDKVGIYSLCYSLSLPTSALWTAMNNAWLPRYKEYLAHNDIEQINQHVNNMLRTFSCATIAFIFISPEFIKIMSSPKYWDGSKIMPIIILSTFFTFLYGFPSNYLFFEEKTKYISAITVLGVMTNIILNYFFIPRYSIWGAAFTTLLSQFLITLLNDIFARFKVKNYPIKFSRILISTLIVSACTFIFYFSYDIIIARYLFVFVIIFYYFKASHSVT